MTKLTPGDRVRIINDGKLGTVVTVGNGPCVSVKVDQVGGACHTGDRTCWDADVLDAVTGERPGA